VIGDRARSGTRRVGTRTCVVPFYHQRRLPVAKINPSLTMLGDEEGVIIRQIRTFQMDQSLENRIRERAYEIWTAHGCVHGQADQHWLAAEREILATSTPALAREPASKKKRRSPARSKAARTLALAG
jgi:Protein of unknown function (DUF2934)